MKGSKLRLNSKEERAEILVQLTRQLAEILCKDIEVLTQVDRLCRRTWHDIHPGWIAWASYMEGLLGTEKYQAWAKKNCYSITSEVNKK